MIVAVINMFYCKKSTTIRGRLQGAFAGAFQGVYLTLGRNVDS